MQQWSWWRNSSVMTDPYNVLKGTDLIQKCQINESKSMLEIVTQPTYRTEGQMCTTTTTTTTTTLWGWEIQANLFLAYTLHRELNISYHKVFTHHTVCKYNLLRWLLTLSSAPSNKMVSLTLAPGPITTLLPTDTLGPSWEKHKIKGKSVMK